MRHGFSRPLFVSKVDEIARQLQEVELVLGLCFRNKDLLRLALTHSSSKSRAGHNERLELLGDSILGFCITEHLYCSFPDCDEGQLSKQKSYIVSAESLAAAAREYGLGRFILMGKGEALDGGRDKDSLLANAMESIIGACYLDQGMESARALVLFLLAGQLEGYQDNGSLQDAKLHLQQYVQKKYKDLPRYETQEIRKGHTTLGFKAKLYINGEFICAGEGASKKRAEKQAARFALEHIIIDEQGRSN